MYLLQGAISGLLHDGIADTHDDARGAELGQIADGGHDLICVLVAPGDLIEEENEHQKADIEKERACELTHLVAPGN